MNNTTLLFLIKREEGQIKEICLAMKKRGFGEGKWNGIGGKPDVSDKNIEGTARRETREEINVEVDAFEKIAELTFEFLYKPEWDQLVHVYFCEKWQGDPAETEEMSPKWFAIDNLPFKDMWPDDWYWLPKVLKGDFVKASFKFLEGNKIKEYTINGDVNNEIA